MVKLKAEIVNNTIVVIICVLTIVILTTILVVGEPKESEVLQGGDIQHAIDTEQF
jgi:hypothetical protein